MRRETAGVTESLLQAAKEEFLTYGFHDASMRRISAACGVSTNSIYTRFGDKSGLFTAIVQEAADGLMEMYMQSIQKATECPDMDHAIEEGNEGTDQVLAYIYRYKEEFQLLFCHSVGTEYEDYFDKLAAIEEQYYNIFAKQYANENATTAGIRLIRPRRQSKLAISTSSPIGVALDTTLSGRLCARNVSVAAEESITIFRIFPVPSVST